MAPVTLQPGAGVRIEAARDVRVVSMTPPSAHSVARRLLQAEPCRPVVACPELSAHQAADVFALWQRWEALTQRTQPPPFWAAVWPAAALLARVLLDHPAWVEGRRVIDIGGGSGVAAIAARRAGAAPAIVNDIDAAALDAATLNAEVNGVSVEVLHRDLTTEDMTFGEGDVLMASDVFYEEQPSQRLLGLLEAARTRGARVLISDGGRAFTPGVRSSVLCEAVLPVDEGLEGVAERRVRVYAL
jgi:predicted nicotinamide N-methyase